MHVYHASAIALLSMRIAVVVGLFNDYIESFFAASIQSFKLGNLIIFNALRGDFSVYPYNADAAFYT